ncbi:TIGR02594 family protein [Terrihabitans soli]|uniref:TIGR02594 family protein n=1 Tax=Terrihabitans soli TaxID=708113 RepID=A0A6S6QGU6_9HYPH|nr:TIGR02594 family protein [Terrihabitans soli]BCJ90373.1 TIGR02594 family protein [Terrihabitans soli]
MPKPLWYLEVERRKGLHEVKNRSLLSAFLKSDGRTLGDPSRLPWCGDLVETAIRTALPQEKVPANPYLARNWLSFGKLVKPCLGAIMVFDGGKRPPPSGHVCFYAGEDATHFHVLGGNQSNAISIMRIDRRRLLKNGTRWPLTAPPPAPQTGEVAAQSSALAVSDSEA